MPSFLFRSLFDDAASLHFCLGLSSLSPLALCPSACFFLSLLFPALRVSASSSSSLPYPGLQTGYLGAESLLTMDAVSGG